MRVFAGPNGSGKSTLQSLLSKRLLGYYINADEIEVALKNSGFFDFSHYGIDAPLEGLQEFLYTSPLFVRAANCASPTTDCRIDGTKIFLAPRMWNSYAAAALAAYLRDELLRSGVSFTFETVMSHESKVEFMGRARAAGFRVYLYYVATADPKINVTRVKSRVLAGGHNVPEDKILSRYSRSLALLYGAIRNSNRAFIFDNSLSNKGTTWIAECADGREFELKVDVAPDWFTTYVLDRSELI